MRLGGPLCASAPMRRVARRRAELTPAGAASGAARVRPPARGGGTRSRRRRRGRAGRGTARSDRPAREPARRAAPPARHAAAGPARAVRSSSATTTRSGHRTSGARRLERWKPTASVDRAATAGSQSEYCPSGSSAVAVSASASGVDNSATVPGSPTSGTSRGGRPSSPPIPSISPSQVSLTIAPGVVNRAAFRVAAGPSTFGVWAMAAATRGSVAAISTTCPPDTEKPQTASRDGSTSGSPATKSSAALQSCSCSPSRMTWRGVPSLSPRCR